MIQDDFPGIVGSLRASDLAVFATPVYFGTLAESLRAFLDRLRRTCVNEVGQKGMDGKPVVGVCVAGGGGGGAPSCCVDLERVLHTCGFEVLDLIPARRQNLDMKREAAEILGKWLAKRLAS